MSSVTGYKYQHLPTKTTKMKSFESVEGLLDENNQLEMAMYHECLRLQKHLEHHKNKDLALASMYGVMAASLGGILLEKTGRMTYEELNHDNDEFDK